MISDVVFTSYILTMIIDNIVQLNNLYNRACGTQHNNIVSIFRIVEYIMCVYIYK